MPSHFKYASKKQIMWKIQLTGLSCWIFYEKWRYVLVHSHFIFSNAGVGTSVFIPNTTDMKFASICCKEDIHLWAGFPTAANCSLLPRPQCEGFPLHSTSPYINGDIWAILMRVLFLSISTNKLCARTKEQPQVQRINEISCMSPC